MHWFQNNMWLGLWSWQFLLRKVIRTTWGSSKSIMEVLKGASALASVEGWLQQPTVMGKPVWGRGRIRNVWSHTSDPTPVLNSTYWHSRTGWVGMPCKRSWGVTAPNSGKAAFTIAFFRTSLCTYSPKLIFYSLTFSSSLWWKPSFF